MTQNKIQTVVKYDCENKNDESFENMYFDIPEIINTDISFQLVFGYEYNYKEERRLMHQHHNKNITLEIDEKSIFNH